MALVLLAVNGCCGAPPPVDFALVEPVVPPDPPKNAKIGTDPATGDPVFLVPPADMAADLKWKKVAKGEIRKGQVNTRKANGYIKKVQNWTH